MTKKWIICSTVFAFIFSIALIASNSYASNTGEADMTLTTAAAKKPATFPHKQHQDMYGCKDCHHGKDADGKQIELANFDSVAKCVSCHNSTDMTDPKLNNFKGAAHGNCKDCHKKVNKEGKNAPTKCNGCHPKK